MAVPVPGPRQILIRVDATALNFRDEAIVDGVYDPDIFAAGPLVLASDAVGIVERVGRGVAQERVATASPAI